MFNSDVIEPTDNLYQEGNIIGKYLNNKRKDARKKNQSNLSSKDKKIHKYQNNDLGSLIDIEV